MFRSLAARLDEVTAGLIGPGILSDRPYRPGSVVHYRYGGFTRRQRLSNDAERILVIAAPDGSLVEDERNAWFAPPSWVLEPLPDRPAPAAATTTTAGRVVLDGRFLAHGAIRQSNRGGVYRATDLRSGSEVIVKQARRGVVGNTGEDAQAALRREMRNLTELAPLGFTPAGLALFEQGGDLFLAQELIDGEPLRMWIRRHSHVIGPRTPARPGVGWTELVPILRRLVEMLATLHGAGWALCDLSPANVMVTGSCEVRLVDLEATGEQRFLGWAEDLARLIDCQHIVHAGRRLVPDETRAGFGAEYGVGMSGVLDFLLRLRHGGPRLWLPATASSAR